MRTTNEGMPTNHFHASGDNYRLVIVIIATIGMIALAVLSQWLRA